MSLLWLSEQMNVNCYASFPGRSPDNLCLSLDACQKEKRLLLAARANVLDAGFVSATDVGSGILTGFPFGLRYAGSLRID